MDNYMKKFQAAASKVGTQATAFAQTTGQQLNQQAKLAQQGFSLPKECEKAARILQSFLADPEHPDSALNSIPKAVLQQAKGLAVFSVVKAGFVWSGKAGSGVVVARLPDGSWSAPSCIATGGVGFGLQVGADLSEFVVVLNSPEAVRSFCVAGNLTIGGSLSAAAGPIGTGGAVQMALSHPAPMFSYSRSKGMYAGLSLEGTVLFERKDANKEFYGQPIPAKDLLEGRVPPPEAAAALYDIVEAAEGISEEGIPQEAYIPSQTPGEKGQPVTAYNLGGSSAPAGTHPNPQNSAGGNASEKGGASKPIFDAGSSH
jgi:lipid-binding SYLF domain-containing protein